jgi:hypothetical protein
MTPNAIAENVVIGKEMNATTFGTAQHVANLSILLKLVQ